jgi:predicted HicB family RNase H-like nuclease
MKSKQVRVPDDLHRELKSWLKKTGMKIEKWVERHLREALKEEKQTDCR